MPKPKREGLTMGGTASIKVTGSPHVGAMEAVVTTVGLLVFF